MAVERTKIRRRQRLGVEPRRERPQLTIEGWLQRLRRDQEHLERASVAVLTYMRKLGEHLSDARDAIASDQWLRLFPPHPRQAGSLDITPELAEELIALAGNDEVARRRPRASLPAGVHFNEFLAHVMTVVEMPRLRRLWPVLFERAVRKLSRKFGT